MAEQSQPIANSQSHQQGEVDDTELLGVIADFLEMGHVENIVAMFAATPLYYSWTGKFLTDERFAVRLGVSVLFEYLVDQYPDDVQLAIPSLKKALNHPTPWVRGKAVSVLAIIGTHEALTTVAPMVNDQDIQVASIARDIMKEGRV